MGQRGSLCRGAPVSGFTAVAAIVLWILAHLHWLVAASLAEMEASEMATILYLLANEMRSSTRSLLSKLEESSPALKFRTENKEKEQ
jgi:hypothetical protein